MFVEHAVRRCAEIISRGKSAVIVGGTGLYIKALVDGLADLPPSDPAVRRQLSDDLRTRGPHHLYEQLFAVDPAAAEQNRLNPQRLMRSLEVYRLTGIPVSRLHESTRKPTGYHFRQFALDWPRAELNALLDTRTAEMFASGLIDETRGVIDRGYSPGDPGLEGIGYRHVIRHLDGLLPLAAAIEQTQRDTRRYAKRQVTWFKSDARVHHIPCAKAAFDPAAIARTIADSLAGQRAENP
jgi:tRNA dimethylallyltransferase